MTTTDDEFLPDEYVLDDVPDDGQGPAVIFAGPSDAPPVLPAAPPPPAPRASREHYKLVAAACLAAAAVVGAILGVSRPTPAGNAASVVRVSSATDPAPESSAATALSPNSASPAVTASSLGSASSATVPALSAVPPPSASAEPDAENPTLGAAKQAKREAEHALEKGRTDLAIEAGARAVALDPTDAEAWLILGAGYDQRRSYGDARKCFATCAHVATHGPRRECAALLR